MKILSIVGARPQFVKAAAVSRELRRDHQEVLLHTGQHYDDEMSATFFRELEIAAPDYNLGVGSGTHAHQTAAMLTGIEDVALKERPDWMVVYGDTNSTLAGALAAVKLQISIAHVEAGLRSFDRSMPEEVNRVLTDHVSSLCFCPTELAVRNLARESIESGVHLVGDVMYDLLLRSLPRLDGRISILDRQGLRARGYVLATLHRAENVDRADRLRSIMEGLASSDLPVLLPAHPRTRASLRQLDWPGSAAIRILDPVGYLTMLGLERGARAIVTDSGGVQKEAYLVGTPCITVRDRTEWTETVSTGWNVLVGAGSEAIAKALRDFAPTSPRPPLFGDGRAAEKIRAVLTTAST